MTLIISHQDLNSDVLLNLLPMSPGLTSKTRVRLTGCAIDIWIGACPTGIFCRFWFSHSTVYIWQPQQVYGKGNEIQKGKGHFLLLSYALALLAVWLQAHWHVHLDDHPSCPETWPQVALGQVFGSVLLLRPNLDPSLARDPRTIFPRNIGWCSGTYYELGKQWITLLFSVSQAREGNEYLTSQNKCKLQSVICKRTKRTTKRT